VTLDGEKIIGASASPQSARALGRKRGAIAVLPPGAARSELDGRLQAQHGRLSVAEPTPVFFPSVLPYACYTARVNTVAAYCDVSRDLAAPDGALRLTGLAPGRHGNVVAPDAALGARATVGPACVVAAGASLGDRASVKRSALGARVRVGASAKVVNSVLMDGAFVGAGASLHGCVLAAGASVGDGAVLRECQLGAGVAVPADAEHTGEALAAAPPA
jgi:hypothetical protein